MDSFYKITIPEPCHENWSAMTPNEKGRFCDSCSKTVVDFTKLDQYQIQDFLDENREKKLCGHFKQTQLDSINLLIPQQIIKQQQSYHKLFLLVLLIVMGTSLMNCTNNNGELQKIDSVELVGNDRDTINYILGGLPNLNDTQVKKTTEKITEDEIIPELYVEGEIVPVAGMIELRENTNPPYNIHSIDSPPEFKNTPQNLSLKEKRDYFSDSIRQFVKDNFNIETSTNLGLKGRQRIAIQFTIDSLGKTTNIKARAQHLTIEKEAIRVISKLPHFTPGKHNGKNVAIVFSLPIIFQVQD